MPASQWPFLIGALLIGLCFFCNALTLLYDVNAGDEGVQVILFLKLRIKNLPYNNIDYIVRRKYQPLFPAAVRLTNRFFSDGFTIVLKKNNFAPAVFVTPKDPDEFLAVLKGHGVSLRS